MDGAVGVASVQGAPTQADRNTRPLPQCCVDVAVLGGDQVEVAVSRLVGFGKHKGKTYTEGKTFAVARDGSGRVADLVRESACDLRWRRGSQRSHPAILRLRVVSVSRKCGFPETEEGNAEVRVGQLMLLRKGCREVADGGPPGGFVQRTRRCRAVETHHTMRVESATGTQSTKKR